ncbi:hypothetical protein [Chryseobacterium sp. CBTAP 102]|uniref:hypothetical protein n=1 Tax=Chryseobacterium sp. CBTAP 102 TaxID=2135644 RepID=UPI000D76D58D|nr:hypothetical protein [Chryseobacterium sp. CBTAP 102]
MIILYTSISKKKNISLVDTNICLLSLLGKVLLQYGLKTYYTILKRISCDKKRNDFLTITIIDNRISAWKNIFVS